MMIQTKRKSWLERYWYLPLVVGILFLAWSIPVYAYLTGFNIYNVGATIYSIFAVGQTTFSQLLVGGYSTNETSNGLASQLFPILAVVAVIVFALKSLSKSDGIGGFFQTILILVIGAAMLLAVVVILSQLT